MLVSRRATTEALSAGAASAAFGLYHVAHGSPFNLAQMVALLSAVGLVTSLFFFATRDGYGTIAFHNFLGIYGVLQALREAGELGRYEARWRPS